MKVNKFEIGQKVIEVCSNIQGEIVDFAPNDWEGYTIGILWEDEDGVWWYKEQDENIKFKLV